jgi:hypothetical protein
MIEIYVLISGALGLVSTLVLWRALPPGELSDAPRVVPFFLGLLLGLSVFIFSLTLLIHIPVIPVVFTVLIFWILWVVHGRVSGWYLH